MCKQIALAELDKEIDAVMTDPSSSGWLKEALQAALARDPVDIANEAEFLSDLLGRRCNSLLATP